MWTRYVLASLVACFGAGTWFVYEGVSDAPPASAQVRQGIRNWQKHNCASCHQLYGLGGYMGPDLTNVHGDKGQARIRTYVRYGTGRMPAHAMDDKDLDALVAFLAWVDASGRSQVPAEAVHWTGTYTIPSR
jgi:nitric oxide reductase subunit C